jgi:hypothetical protein
MSWPVEEPGARLGRFLGGPLHLGLVAASQTSADLQVEISKRLLALSTDWCQIQPTVPLDAETLERLRDIIERLEGAQLELEHLRRSARLAALLEGRSASESSDDLPLEGRAPSGSSDDWPLLRPSIVSKLKEIHALRNDAAHGEVESQGACLPASACRGASAGGKGSGSSQGSIG